jgi:hypothetical protein
MSTFTKRIDSGLRGLEHEYDGSSWVVYEEGAWFLGRYDQLGFVNTQNISFRFVSVTIPAGSVITSAKITFKSDQSATPTVVLGITGVDEDNTAEFVVSPESSARTRTHTTATVAWSGSIAQTQDSDLDTPDIKTIVQEIVDRGSWASGNAMGFYLYDNGTSGNNTLRFYDYEDNVNYAALLTVTYTSPSFSPSISPSVSISPSLSPSVSPSLGGSLSPSISPSFSPSVSPSVSKSPSFSPSASSSVSVSPSKSPSISPSISPSPPFYGIKISKPTFDVLTENNPDNLIFSSDYDSLKYYAEGSVDLVVTGSNAEAYVTHNLGYIPFFITYVNYVPLVTDYSTVPFYFAETGANIFINSYATSTRIYFTVATNTASQTFTFKYKIFRNNTTL